MESQLVTVFQFSAFCSGTWKFFSRDKQFTRWTP